MKKTYEKPSFAKGALLQRVAATMTSGQPD